MNILKKALKYFGFTLLGLLLAGLLLPYVFKDKLINYLKNDINNSLNAIIDFDDANLSFIKSFLPTVTPPNTRPCQSINFVAE